MSFSLITSQRSVICICMRVVRSLNAFEHSCWPHQPKIAGSDTVEWRIGHHSGQKVTAMDFQLAQKLIKSCRQFRAPPTFLELEIRIRKLANFRHWAAAFSTLLVVHQRSATYLHFLSCTRSMLRIRLL